MLEGTFNLRVTKSIKSRGIFCYKVADKFHAGIPDIYVAGGIWIESKVIKVGKQNRLISVYAKMRPAQHNFARDLIASGDRVIFCARIEASDGAHLMFIPYWHLQNRQNWVVEDLKKFPLIGSESEYDMSKYFHDDYADEDNLNYDWYFEPW